MLPTGLKRRGLLAIKDGFEVRHGDRAEPVNSFDPPLRKSEGRTFLEFILAPVMSRTDSLDGSYEQFSGLLLKTPQAPGVSSDPSPKGGHKISVAIPTCGDSSETSMSGSAKIMRLVDSGPFFKFSITPLIRT